MKKIDFKTRALCNLSIQMEEELYINFAKKCIELNVTKKDFIKKAILNQLEINNMEVTKCK